MTPSTLDTLATVGANFIRESFDFYHQKFKELTLRAKGRFEKKDWEGEQEDDLERLDLFPHSVNNAVAHLKLELRENSPHRELWKKIKNHYSDLLKGLPNRELAETFFNSVARRVLATEGYDEELDFLGLEKTSQDRDDLRDLIQTHPVKKTFFDPIRDILLSYSFSTPFVNLDRDCRLAAEKIDAQIQKGTKESSVPSIEMLRPVFYRNKAAYLIGRLHLGKKSLPLIFPLLNEEGGIFLDAVLLTEDEASIVFSFTRSYFFVAAEQPRRLIHFLKMLMPLKPIAELYISIGFNKHGKTELHRDLLKHLRNSKEKFELARGEKGMVMIVFTLPSYDVVFKMIRDSFAPPKNTTPDQVKAKYNLVFKHDRAGRLVDAQEFEFLEFEKARFSQEVLEELRRHAPSRVEEKGNKILLNHLYIERRLYPLDLFAREAEATKAEEAAIDFGNTIKDLARANIFPGDLLLKNFGVTRHGRVVCYDYDELCFLTDLNILKIPENPEGDDISDGEPWFYAKENDFFPEEIKTFMGFGGSPKEAFRKTHSDLFGVDFWLKTQKKVRQKELPDIFPYKVERRLRG